MRQRSARAALGVFSLAFAAAAGAQTVSFATLPPGALLHAQASVMAKVIQDNSKLQVRVVGYGGEGPAFDAVNTQKADFMIVDIGESADAAQGIRNWEGKGKPNMRAAITMHSFQVAWFVRKDSNMQQISDLKGKKVGSEFVQQTGNAIHAAAQLAAGDLTFNDVVRVPQVNVVRAADDFKSGKLDVFSFAVGAPKVAEVAASVGGVRMLPFTAEMEPKLKKVRQEYYLTRVNPAPHIAGVEKPMDAMTFDVIVSAGTHVKDEVVYEFVKALHGNKPPLVEGHPGFNRFDPKEACKPQPRMKYHPGAEKFCKEAGLWRS